MVTLSKGLINSLVILEFIRNNEELKNYDISVGTFTNCREAGLTFIVSGYTDKNREYHVIEPFTYCIYEHRNSDDIIINGKDGYISANGDLPYNGKYKYDYIVAFEYNQHYECSCRLAELITNHVTICLDDEKKKQEKLTIKTKI